MPLTLNDLDGDVLRSGGYATAVRQAVHAHGERAFVLESRTERADLPEASRLVAMINPGATLTRMSTIVPAQALTDDAHFDTPYPDFVPNERYASATPVVRSRDAGIGALAALLLVGGFRRRQRARARPARAADGSVNLEALHGLEYDRALAEASDVDCDR